MGEPDPREPALRAWREAYARLTAEGGPSCPPVERLASLAIGELVDAERDAVADHVVACRACSSAMRDLLALHAESLAALAPRKSRRPAAWILAAAALVAVALAVPALVRWDRPGPSSSRGTVPEVRPLEPHDRAALEAPPERFAWPPEPGAARYHVVLFDAESTTIWESPATVAPEIELPAEIREALRAGGAFTWRVVAVVGVERRTSDLHRFRVAP